MNVPAPQALDRIKAQAGHVGVLMGGRAAEREISLRSGGEVVRGLTDAGLRVSAIDWNGTAAGLLAHEDIDRYFVALHGRGGEDGQVQAMLDLMGVPYTGSGVLGCALAMDKSRAKLAWLGAGLPTPPFELVTSDSDPQRVIERLGLPLFVKPAREGSSIGVSRVDSADALGAAVVAALRSDSLVIAERAVQGAEYTVSILGQAALPVIRLEAAGEFYDFHAKYEADNTRYLIPSGLDATREQAIQKLALEAFGVLDGRGWGRIDLMCDDAGEPWLIELNTVPGMTDHSLVPMAARAVGMSFSDLVVAILGSSMPEVSLS